MSSVGNVLHLDCEQVLSYVEMFLVFVISDYVQW